MERMRLRKGQETNSLMGGIYRRYQREKVVGFSGDIADGSYIITGDVDNVSTNGFKIINIKDKFRGEKHCYQAIIVGAGKHYKLLAKPCWKKQTVNGMEVGFKIVDAPWEWFEFVLESVPSNRGRYVPQGHA